MNRPINLREQQRIFTRNRFVEAAANVFARNGYVATTVDDVVSEAGASRATFYLHFRNKTEVVISLLEQRSGDLGRRRFAELADILLIDAPEEARNRLWHWLAAWLPVWRSGSDVSRAIAQAAALEPEVEEAWLRDSEVYMDAMEPYFQHLPASRRSEARQRAIMLEVISRRAYALAAAHRAPLEDDQLIDFLSDLWWHAFRPGEGARRPQRPVRRPVASRRRARPT